MSSIKERIDFNYISDELEGRSCIETIDFYVFENQEKLTAIHKYSYFKKSINFPKVLVKNKISLASHKNNIILLYTTNKEGLTLLFSLDVGREEWNSVALFDNSSFKEAVDSILLDTGTKDYSRLYDIQGECGFEFQNSFLEGNQYNVQLNNAHLFNNKLFFVDRKHNMRYTDLSTLKQYSYNYIKSDCCVMDSFYTLERGATAEHYGEIIPTQQIDFDKVIFQDDEDSLDYITIDDHTMIVFFQLADTKHFYEIKIDKDNCMKIQHKQSFHSNEYFTVINHYVSPTSNYIGLLPDCNGYIYCYNIRDNQMLTVQCSDIRRVPGERYNLIGNVFYYFNPCYKAKRIKITI